MSWTKWISFTLMSTAFSMLPLLADDDPDIDLENFSQEQISSTEQQSPFSLTGRFDIVNRTDIREGFYEGDSVDFGEADVEAAMVFYHSPAYKEGANVALSYTITRIHWANNPWFAQERFNTVTLNLGVVSGRFCRWTWRGQLGFSIDANEWEADYAYYDLLLWGRYEYCRNIGFHIGLIAQTGMRMDRVYPILGADWQMSKSWKLNLVFPVNVSLEYVLNKYWSFAFAGRSFDSRHRAGKSESNAKSLLRYENLGAEFAVRYASKDITGNLHAGYTLGGQLRIADRYNHHPHHYKLNPAPYVGAEVVCNF